jgi:peptidoglycan hydrolase-like protein with peptidoglycan-binding domain
MKRALAVIGIVAALGAAAVAATGLAGRKQPAEATGARAPSTAQVTRQTLRETEEADGELGYGPVTSAINRQPGTVTWLPASGSRVKRGEPLFKLDNKPVPLMYGSIPAFRNLSAGTEGADVEQWERNLNTLGYKGFTVDEKFSESTAAAVKRWQKDLGLEETGVVELGRVVFADSEIRVDTLQLEAGQPAGAGQKVLTYTGTAKVVTVKLDAGDQRLAKVGGKVKVTMPDGKPVEGTITKVSTIIQPKQGSQSDLETKLEVLVSVGDTDFDSAAVDVTFTASERKDVLTVPVAALTALHEGGFGVEVIEGSGSRFLPVQTGLFAGGRVEVSGEGLVEGMTVGMPKP